MPAEDISPDPKGNIELVHFGNTALLLQKGEDSPYLVVEGYDRASGEWSGPARRFDDLGRAFDAADPDIIEDASVRFTKKDVREALESQGVEPTEQNVSFVIGEHGVLEGVLDPAGLNAIAREVGLDRVNETIRACIETGGLEIGRDIDRTAPDLDEIMDSYNPRDFPASLPNRLDIGYGGR